MIDPALLPPTAKQRRTLPPLSRLLIPIVDELASGAMIDLVVKRTATGPKRSDRSYEGLLTGAACGPLRMIGAPMRMGVLDMVEDPVGMLCYKHNSLHMVFDRQHGVPDRIVVGHHRDGRPNHRVCGKITLCYAEAALTGTFAKYTGVLYTGDFYYRRILFQGDAFDAPYESKLRATLLDGDGEATAGDLWSPLSVELRKERSPRYAW